MTYDDGLLSGTPAAGSGGVYPLTITASNGFGSDDVQSFTLEVNEAPAITSANAATFTVGSAGSFSVAASGYPAPTLSVSGTLPNGVSLSAAGVLSGTPAAGSGGTYPLSITASNGIGNDATQSFTLTVNEAPAITSANATTFVVGSAGNFALSASGYPAPMFNTTGPLPNGVSLSAVGVLSGTPMPGTGGVYHFTVTASNGSGSRCDAGVHAHDQSSAVDHEREQRGLYRRQLRPLHRGNERIPSGHVERGGDVAQRRHLRTGHGNLERHPGE